MAEPAEVVTAPGSGDAAENRPVLPPLTPVPPPSPDPDPATPPTGGESSRSAEDVNRLITWLSATFTPPQAWTDRPPSAKEALEAARATELSGRWGAARKASGYVCAAIVTVLVVAAWIAHSPARIATTALLVGAVRLTWGVIF